MPNFKKEGISISAYTKQALAAVAVIVAILVVFPLVKLYYGKHLLFSKEPGYYDSPFYLTILGGAKNTVHYTLDGSEPTTADPVYDGKNPIYIEDATSRPNVYSLRTDTSTGFLTDLIDQYVPWDPAAIRCLNTLLINAPLSALPCSTTTETVLTPLQAPILWTFRKKKNTRIFTPSPS